MSNGDPNVIPVPDVPGPNIPPAPLLPGRRRPPKIRGPIVDRPPPEARFPIATPVPVPVEPIFVPSPSSRLPAPGASTGAGIGSILSRANLAGAIGAVAIELLERVLGELQARRAQRMIEEAEAEIEMIRGRIAIRERDELVVTTAAGGDIATVPPPPPGLSGADRFPFPDPFESPLGDDPLPGRVGVREPPGVGGAVAPLEECVTDECLERRFGFPIELGEPVAAPSPVSDPVTIPAPSLPVPETLPQPIPAPAPAPATRPGTPTRPAPSPFPFPSPVGRPVASPRPVFFVSPFADPRGIRDPTRFQDPATPPTLLTVFEPVSVPSQVGRPTRQCQPCPEQQDEPRLQCFRKMVKEKLLPSEDETFNWTEIDCITGRELPKG